MRTSSGYVLANALIFNVLWLLACGTANTTTSLPPTSTGTTTTGTTTGTTSTTLPTERPVTSYEIKSAQSTRDKITTNTTDAAVIDVSVQDSNGNTPNNDASLKVVFKVTNDIGKISPETSPVTNGKASASFTSEKIGIAKISYTVQSCPQTNGVEQCKDVSTKAVTTEIKVEDSNTQTVAKGSGKPEELKLIADNNTIFEGESTRLVAKIVDDSKPPQPVKDVEVTFTIPKDPITSKPLGQFKSTDGKFSDDTGVMTAKTDSSGEAILTYISLPDIEYGVNLQATAATLTKSVLNLSVIFKPNGGVQFVVVFAVPQANNHNTLKINALASTYPELVLIDLKSPCLV